MSDTPRTDAQPPVEIFNGEGTEETRKYVDRDFARELERENAKLREGIENLTDAINSVQSWEGTRVGECMDELEAIICPS